MSVQAVLEFAVYFDSFRNINLYNQGVYCFRTQILSSSLKQAYPYNQLTYARNQIQAHCIMPQSVRDSFAYSKSFLVKYFQENIQLKQTVTFRLELPFKLNQNQETLKLRFDLLFTGVQGQTTASAVREEMEETSEFMVISSCSYELLFPCGFKKKFLPVTFDDNCCCLINTTIQYSLIDYKFSLPNGNLGQALAKVIFPQKKQHLFSVEDADCFYQIFVSNLVKCYQELRDYYLSVVGKCISSRNRNRLGKISIPQPISFQREYGDTYRKPLSKSLSQASDQNETDIEEGPFIRLTIHGLVAELNVISAQMFQLWHKFTELNLLFNREICVQLRHEYKTDLKKTLSKSAIKKVIKSADLKYTHYNDASIITIARHLRQKIGSSPIIVEELQIFDPDLTDPEVENSSMNTFLLSSLTKQQNQRLHICVLVHGFQGTSTDMKLVKNSISAEYPQILILSSAANENNTDDSIQVLGRNLAQEVIGYIQQWTRHYQLRKLSFIGHSLGGLIIRAALPFLEEFSEQMHLFMSLSSPHLGIYSQKSSLVNAGIWLIKSVIQAPSLSQLSLSDSKTLSETYLYKLSNQKGPQWFSHFVLVSSPQDKYVPHYSARLQSSIRPQVAEMNSNILERRLKLSRIAVHFDISSKSLDSWIGRTAHIQLIENKAFLQNLLLLHPEYFC